MPCNCLLGNAVRQHYTGCDAVDGGTYAKTGDKHQHLYRQYCSHCRRPLGVHQPFSYVGADGVNHRGDNLLRRLAGSLRIIIIRPSSGLLPRRHLSVDASAFAAQPPIAYLIAMLILGIIIGKFLL